VCNITGLLVPDSGFTPQASPAGSDDRLFNKKDCDAERADVSYQFMDDNDDVDADKILLVVTCFCYLI